MNERLSASSRLSTNFIRKGYSGSGYHTIQREFGDANSIPSGHQEGTKSRINGNFVI
jgi:hypothetical protein